MKGQIFLPAQRSLRICGNCSVRAAFRPWCVRWPRPRGDGRLSWGSQSRSTQRRSCPRWGDHGAQRTSGSRAVVQRSRHACPGRPYERPAWGTHSSPAFLRFCLCQGHFVCLLHCPGSCRPLYPPGSRCCVPTRYRHCQLIHRGGNLRFGEGEMLR